VDRHYAAHAGERDSTNRPYGPSSSARGTLGLSRLADATGAGCGGRRSPAVRDMLVGIDAGQRILDVGSGPHSYLLSAGLRPIGSDISEAYIRQYARDRRVGIVNSADALPLRSGCFDSVWTIGLIHHLPDHLALQTIREMHRVCRPGGHVMMLDAVMPRHAWARPVAYALRKLDRGQFVRTETALRNLLSQALPGPQEIRRATFSHTGIEMLTCRTQREAVY
jgi:SAM-dependent methyltransferase